MITKQQKVLDTDSAEAANNFADRMLKWWNYVWYGDTIRIDASSLCQLRCPVCQKWNLKEKVGAGYLQFKDFKKFVDTYRNFKYIEISNNGEIFLNPELNQIIKHAFDMGIRLSAQNGVNLNTISDETIDCLVKYRFGPINISIDGASDETYAIYRAGGSFTRVIENISKINICKQKYSSNSPELTWRFIVFGHNEQEIPVARKMAQELNINFELLRNVDPEYSPVMNERYLSEQMGFQSVKVWKDNSDTAANSLWFCNALWESIQINWDGKLLGCCCNTDPFFCNVFEIGLQKAIKNKEYMYAKKMLAGKLKARNNIPCSKCQTYKYRLEKKYYVNEVTLFLSGLLSRFKRLLVTKMFLRNGQFFSFRTVLLRFGNFIKAFLKQFVLYI